jgi:hypothetical protein
MKSSSFAIPTLLLFAADCIGVNSVAFGCQQGNPDPKPCVQANVSCAGQVANTPALGIQAQPSPAATEKVSFNILAELSGGLNVKKLKPGDKIKAQVAQDVLWHGKIIIPEESILMGHVTEVKRRTVDSPESRLGLVFDRVLLKRHKEVDFQGVIEALSPPAQRRSKVDEPDQMLPPSTMTAGPNSSGPMGGGVSPSRGASNVSSKSVSIATMPAGVPVYTEANPGSNPGNAVGSARATGSLSEQKPMSAGMPHGVFGIKGLSLTLGPSSSTPGPVIVSNAIDVKLEDGTQVQLKVTDPKVRER